MSLRIHTETGSVYDYDGDLMRRSPEEGAPLRRDGDWIRVLACTVPTVGESWHLVLQVRSDEVVTVRVTSHVTSLEVI
jgi:hypothetical protein